MSFGGVLGVCGHQERLPYVVEAGAQSRLSATGALGIAANDGATLPHGGGDCPDLC